MTLGPGCVRLTIGNVKLAPREAGIYFIYDRDEIIYIGKAILLRDRMIHHVMGRSRAGIWSPDTVEGRVWEEVDFPVPGEWFSDEEARAFKCGRDEIVLPIRGVCETLMSALMSCFSFRYILVDADDCQKEEKTLIRKHQPKYNVRFCGVPV